MLRWREDISRVNVGRSYLTSERRTLDRSASRLSVLTTASSRGRGKAALHKLPSTLAILFNLQNSSFAQMQRRRISVLRDAVPKRPVFARRLDQVDKHIFLAKTLLLREKLSDGFKERFLELDCPA